MASQKTYSIVINGIKESVKEIDILNAQLDALEKRLTDISAKKKIDVKVSAGAKVDNNLEKEAIKNEKLKIEEYKAQLVETEKLKAENKEIAKVQKEIALGIRDANGEYANTLAGQKAYLSELKSQLTSMDLGAAGWDELKTKVKEVNDNVAKLEESYGVFNRNVGNYKSAAAGFGKISTEAEDASEAIKKVGDESKKTVHTLEDLKGDQRLIVNVQGMDVEFENITQAIGEVDDITQNLSYKLQELRNAGKENTDEFRKLNSEFQELQQTVGGLEKARKFSDELKDSLASASRGLDLTVQGFQALVGVLQIGAGAASLFGASEEEINEQINRTVQLMSIAQGVQELYNQTLKEGTFLAKANAAANSLLGKALPNVAKSGKAATLAMKGLKLSLKGLGIGLAIGLIGKLAGGISDFFTSLSNGTSKLKGFQKIFDSVSNIIAGVSNVIWQLVTGPLKMLINTIDKLLQGDFKGAAKAVVDGVENTYNIVGNYSKAADDAEKSRNKKRLQDAKEKEAKELKYKIDTLEAKGGADAKYSAEAQKLYKEYFAAKLLMYEKDSDDYKQILLEKIRYEEDIIANEKAVNDKKLKAAEDYNKKLQEINDKILDNQLASVKDSHFKRIQELRRQRLREIREARETSIKVNEQIDAINKKYDAEERKEVKAQQEKIKQIYEEAYGELEAYFDKRYKKNFEVSTSFFQQAIDKITNRYEAAATSIKDAFGKIFSVTKEGEDSFKYIFKNSNKYINETVDSIENIGKEYKKVVDKILNNQSSKLIDTESFKEDLTKLIENTNKIFGDAQGTVTANYQESIDRLANYYESVGDVVESSLEEKREKYNKIIQEIFKQKPEKPEYFEPETQGEWEFYKKEYQDYEEALKTRAGVLQLLGEMGKEFPATQKEAQELFEELNKDINNFDEAGKQLFDYIKEGKDVITSFKNVFKNSTDDVKNSYLALIPTINILYNTLKSEDNDYLNRLKEEEEALENIKKKLGEVKKEELDKAKAKYGENSDEYLKKEVEITEKYNKDINDITSQYNQKVETLLFEHVANINEINKNSLEGRNKIILAQNKVAVEYYKNYFDSLEKARDAYKNIDQVDLGNQDLTTIAAFAQEEASVKKFKKTYEENLKSIAKSKEDLDKKFKAGIIDEKTFTQAISELSQLEKENAHALEGMEKTWQEKAKSIAEVAAAGISQITQLFSAFSDMQLNNETKRIEKEKELLDKELEMLEEQLSKQDELYQEHSDNVNSIENELQSARGDRREFLIDQLDSEIAKRESAWGEEQKINRLKEANQRKQEALEKRQKEAERKRNKAQKVIQIAQATASGALAVINALAVQPYPLGMILAKVAAGISAAQIAIIAATKYANGGKIQGKSHAEGGVRGTGAFNNIEVEGSEYIINKRTTQLNEPLIEMVNSKKRRLTLSDFEEFYSNGKNIISRPNGNKYANGGVLPTPSINVKDIVNDAVLRDDREIVVSVQEIDRVSSHLRNVKAQAGLE